MGTRLRFHEAHGRSDLVNESHFKILLEFEMLCINRTPYVRNCLFNSLNVFTCFQEMFCRNFLPSNVFLTHFFSEKILIIDYILQILSGTGGTEWS